MTKGFYNLTSAMLTQGRYLDVISNNMSNVATAGFKTDRFTYSTFQEVMWKLVGNKDKEEYKELGNQSWITAPSRLYTDYSQGALEETGQPLDFAIEGEGFFGIETEEGRALTRNGNFSLDDQGYLCLPGQGRVLGANGNPIQLMTDRIATDSSGGIYTENGGFLGRIGVFMVNDPVESLDKDAHGLFTGEQGTAGSAVVHNEMLERANTDLVQQMVEMISSQRAYQSAAEAIKIYDQVLNKVTTDVGRLS